MLKLPTWYSIFLLLRLRRFKRIGSNHNYFWQVDKPLFSFNLFSLSSAFTGLAARKRYKDSRRYREVYVRVQWNSKPEHSVVLQI